MPAINHTDNSRLDLSDSEELSDLLKQREELSEIVNAGQAAYRERVAIDAKIIDMLGNSKTALGPDDTLISVETQHRREYTVQARVLTYLKIRKDAITRWRRGLRSV